MSVEKVKKYFAAFGLSERIMEFPVSSATVELAAAALNCERGRIAKTLSFFAGEKVIVVVFAGDVKADNAKFKAYFGTKAKMLPPEETERLVGYAVGGVCPFALNEGGGGVSRRFVKTISHGFSRVRQLQQRNRTYPLRAGKIFGQFGLD